MSSTSTTNLATRSVQSSASTSPAKHSAATNATRSRRNRERVARVDHRYERNGKQRIHLATEPLTGWITVKITERRRTIEWIDRMVDHLNTHNPAGFYQFFPPDEARAYLDRFEFHYVPKKGSWLNMAEIELGVLKRQCLNRRIYHAATSNRRVAAWQAHRNAADRLIDWQFTTDDARIKLRQLYPVEIKRNQQDHS